MAYEYENKINEAFFIAGRDGRNVNIELLVELQQVYNKAKAYDLLKEDLLINEKVFREQAENDEVSDIIHGHYVALLVQAELERE